MVRFGCVLDLLYTWILNVLGVEKTIKQDSSPQPVPSFSPSDDSDWNTRRSCSSISHSYHHKCSRCGSKDHGAQNCPQTQKESLSHRMKLNCGTFVSWRDDFTIFHRSHCYGNISMILLTSASPPPLPPVHPRPYYEHYIETLAQRRQDLRRKLLTLQPHCRPFLAMFQLTP